MMEWQRKMYDEVSIKKKDPKTIAIMIIVNKPVRRMGSFNFVLYATYVYQNSNS